MDREQALRLYDEGREALGRADLHAAVSKLQRSVAILPTGPAVAALGESLLALSRYGEAIVHLTAALAMGAEAPRRGLLRTAEALAVAGTCHLLRWATVLVPLRVKSTAGQRFRRRH
jgi:hypothetical protein